MQVNLKTSYQINVTGPELALIAKSLRWFAGYESHNEEYRQQAEELAKLIVAGRLACYDQFAREGSKLKKNIDKASVAAPAATE